MKLLSRLKSKKFELYLAAFLLMLLPAVPLYGAAGRNAGGEIVLWLGLIVAGNLLVLLVG